MIATARSSGLAFDFGGKSGCCVGSLSMRALWVDHIAFRADATREQQYECAECAGSMRLVLDVGGAAVETAVYDR